jgi:hypothetical protein
MKLKSLTIEKLSKLRSEVNTASSVKITEQCRTIKAELQKLSRVAIGGGRRP